MGSEDKQSPDLGGSGLLWDIYKVIFYSCSDKNFTQGSKFTMEDSSRIAYIRFPFGV